MKVRYKVDGRQFKTVGGLCSYLARKHSASHISCIGRDRVLTVYTGGGATNGTVIARYQISAPIIGEPMTLERTA